MTHKTPTTNLDTAPFLLACRGEQSTVTPLWLMRQAGRYMEEYRALRQEYGILDIIKTPELARDVTLQPIDAFDLDAAIIFADILPPLEGMGLSLEFVKGEGPVIHNPIRSEADLDLLTIVPPEQALWFTLDAIKLTREALDPRGIPLIGFSGAPFTLASYAIEGGGSKNHILVKSFLFEQNEAWHRLMGMFAEVVGHYMKAQAAAGAHVLQIFDSWVGALHPDDYRDHVLPYTQKAIAIAKEGGVPIIHFGTNTSGMLPLIKESGADIIGVDWRIRLDHAWDILGHETPIMGNLDPIALFAPWDQLKARTKAVLDQANGRPGHIFNLGHGILPKTPVDNVKRLAEFVHEYSKQ